MSKVRNTPNHRTADYFDGPPIAHCPTQERLLEDARIGSARLKLALDMKGLRP
jgi:hypothetical protein